MIDASVLINSLRMDRVDLIADHSHDFVVTDHVAAEVSGRYPDQQQWFVLAINTGAISQVSITNPTVENLKAHDIHLVSLEERIDTASAARELVFHVFAAIADFEQRLISERTRDGIAAARKRGRRPGRPPLDREIVSATQTLVEAGLTAKQLGIGRATVYRIARSAR